MKKAMSIIFLITVLIGIFAFTYMHESVHKAIFTDYNINSKIKMFDGWDATTTPLGNYSNCKEDCILAHNINEAVGYHLITIYFMLGIELFIIIMILENLGGNNETN
jgi:hypothetical protein